jgi:hypothetical protein
MHGSDPGGRGAGVRTTVHSGLSVQVAGPDVTWGAPGWPGLAVAVKAMVRWAMIRITSRRIIRT